MKLIVGLGNPGPEYAETRHNVGYRVVEALHGRWDFDGWKAKFHGWLSEGTHGGQRVALLRPTTYMNVSGKSVVAAGRFYKCERTDLLVISDDLDLELGTLRIRQRGSSGGQRGMEDIIRCVGSQEFARLRIGIGRPARGDAAAFVLERFHPSERDAAAEVIVRAAEAAECWLVEGPTAAMNRYNRRAE